MKVTYFKNGKEFNTIGDNADLRIAEELSGIRRTVTITALNDIELVGATMDIVHRFKENDLIFANGYQSWTDSFEYSMKDHLRDVNKLPKFLVNTFAFDKYGDIYFHPYDENVIHGYDVAYIKGDSPLFIGSYNSKNAYLAIEMDKKNHLIHLVSDVEHAVVAKGTSFTLLDYVSSTNIEEGMGLYNSQFIQPTADKIFGYTSWYNHYQNIDEKKILDVLEKPSVNINLFQIDDGYETFVGDWLDIDPAKFPKGLVEIVNKIHSRGMKAGVWLAPFAAETKSETFKNHPDWFVKDENGNPIKAGANWSGFYALNIDLPEVVDYVTKCLEYYIDLGFDFFKLDFLYAVNLGVHKGKTRAQVAEEGYMLLRNVLKGKLILGCGGVMSTAAGKFEYMRVGPDVSLIFDDVWFMRSMHRERISTKVTLRNTIYRSFLNGYAFHNDPDVFLLRDDNIKMNEAQKKSLITINALFGGVMMTSDNPDNYNDKQNKMLYDAMDLFRGAENVRFETKSGAIWIQYVLNGKEFSLIYDINKGELKNG